MKRSIEERERIKRMLVYEQNLWHNGHRFVAGIDEAGRGPLAGPVVAAAVVFPQDVFFLEVDDSKRLKPEKRERLAEEIKKNAVAIGIGIVGPEDIDRINILQATYMAMRQAVYKLNLSPLYLLVDGRKIPDAEWPQTPIVKGDSLSFSIAAASIIAKVTRDAIMYDLHRKYPEYGFEKHKGYGTKSHIEAILKFGPSPVHRKTFKVRQWGNN